MALVIFVIFSHTRNDRIERKFKTQNPKSKKMLLREPNTPQLKPRALSPSNSEEHQYDIPFSHLKRTQELHSTTHHRSHDFEDMETSRHHVKQRTSRTSNRTSSGTSTSRGMYKL